MNLTRFFHHLFRFHARPLLIILIAGVALLALLKGVLHQLDSDAESTLLATVFSLFSVFLLVIALLDFYGLRKSSDFAIKRICPTSVAVGTWQTMEYEFTNQSKRRLKYEFYDKLPIEFSLSIESLKGSAARGEITQHQIRFKARARGNFILDTIRVRVSSPLGLWSKIEDTTVKHLLKVFPDFSIIKKYVVLASHSNVAMMGIKRQRRRGQGSNFHQLREYHQNDSLRQIDWSATARHRKLISREYQDEKQQEIMILLDCGKRMRSQDGELSHFDHALNSAMLLAYVALRQGDAVGLMTLGGVDRFLPIRSGAKSINSFHQGTFDIQPSLQVSDYYKAVETLEKRQKKRCLVVLITNLSIEDYSEVLPAITRLQQKRLVLLANLKPSLVDDMMQRKIYDTRSALAYSSAIAYQRSHRVMLQELDARGVITIDSTPDVLLEHMVSAYLSIKGRQQL